MAATTDAPTSLEGTSITSALESTSFMSTTSKPDGDAVLDKLEIPLKLPDFIIIIIYFVLVIAVGIWSSFRNRGSVGGYFLAGRDMHWILVGASLFASNIGSGHFVGLAGTGASSGIGISIFELNAIFVLVLLAWVFVPVYISSGVFTMPEYLRKRFGGKRIQLYLSCLALLLYIFTKISADLFAGAIFIEQSLKWDLYVSILVLLVLAGLFTICGGLTAVIWTDFIQTVIMLIGAFALMIIAFVEVGGYDSMVEKYMVSTSNYTKECAHRIKYNLTTTNDTCQKYGKCGQIDPRSMHLFRPIDDGSLPWLGVTAGLTVSAVWYWCSDQVIVQRVLAAKNLSHAKGGCMFAGYLKILPLFLLVFPGMISRVLYPEEVGCATPEKCYEICKQKTGCTNIAYPLLVIRIMPEGVRGLMLACMMSSLMSSLTSVFNSSSTIFTMDIWRRIRKNAGEMELLIVGRIFTLCLVGIGIAWIPVIKGVSELFHYIQAVTSYLAPPICAVYVLAVLWKRINEVGAFSGLMAGLVVGLIRFIWEFAYPKKPCGEESTLPDIIGKVHYLHFGIILFVVVCIVTIAVSLITKPIDNVHLIRLTYWSIYESGERIDIDEEYRMKHPELEGQDNPGFDAPTKDSKITFVGNGKEYTESTIQISTEKDLKAEKKARETDEKMEKGNEPKMPIYKTVMYWICGIEKMKDTEFQEKTAQEIQEEEDKLCSIEERPIWKTFTNINCVIMLCVAVFICGYYA